MAQPNVSVIMVSYHTGDALWPAIDAVRKQDGLAELILVDNGNPEATLARLQGLAELDPRMRILTGHGNIGFAAAANMAARESKGELLLFMSPGCIMPTGTLNRLAEGLKAVPSAVVASAQLLHADGTEQSGSRRRILNPANGVVESLRLDALGIGQRLSHKGDRAPTEVQPVEAVSSAFMCVRRASFEMLGGFDERYFIYGEDFDFCKAVGEAGGKIVMVPGIEVVEITGSSRVSPIFTEWQRAKSLVRYFRKHYENYLFPFFWVLYALGIYLRFLVQLAVTAIFRLLPDSRDRRASRRLLMLFRYQMEAEEAARQAQEAAELESEQLPDGNALLADYNVPVPLENAVKGRTILVTGASSQLGICLIGRLLALGANVIGVTHKSRVHYDHPRLTWLLADLERGYLPLPDTRIDVCIHAATLPQLPPVLETVLKAGVKRVIAFSSTSVFTKIYSANENERDIVQQLENAELAIVERCQKNRVPVTILRPTMIYGVGLDENVTRIAQVIDRYRIFPIYAPANGRRQPVHADDLAEAAIGLIDNPRSFNKSYNLHGGETLTYRAMVERIFFALGYQPRVVTVKHLPDAMDWLGRLVPKWKINGEMARRMNQDMIFTASEARRDFHFQPRGFLKADAAIWDWAEMSVAYIQGSYVPLQQASIPMFDRGYHFADAVYEVVAFFNCRFLDEDGHLKRLDRSLKELGIAAPMPERALRLVMRELLARNNLQHGGIYLQIGRGTAKRDHAYAADIKSSISMFLFPPKMPPKSLLEKGVNVLVAEDQRWGRCDIKTVGLLPNVIAKQAAALAGARETWLHRDGTVTEGAVSNAFIVKGGAIITQPHGPQILGGVTRDVVLRLARENGIRVEERAFTLEEARAANEAFLTSSTSNVLPVTSIEGKPVGNGGVGLITSRLIDLYADHVERQTGYRLPTP